MLRLQARNGEAKGGELRGDGGRAEKVARHLRAAPFVQRGQNEGRHFRRRKGRWKSVLFDFSIFLFYNY